MLRAMRSVEASLALWAKDPGASASAGVNNFGRGEWSNMELMEALHPTGNPPAATSSARAAIVKQMGRCDKCESLFQNRRAKLLLISPPDERHETLREDCLYAIIAIEQ